MLAARPEVYGWIRLPQQVAHGRLLGDATRVQHDRPLAQLPDHAQVVGDEQQRHAPVADQRPQQLQDLRLDRDVERGRRLVRDEQRRLAGERHRDHHALAHAARQLVGILLGGARRAR